MSISRTRQRYVSQAVIETLEERRMLSGADPTVVDIMVVYTPAARTAAGGDAAILQTIQQSVADTNQAYANSQINITMRLVHSEVITYTESGTIATDLDRLRIKNDGFMDGVHSLRDTYGADLVSLFTNIVLPPGGGTTGLGYVMANTSAPNNDSFGFSVVGQAFAAGPSYTLAHETGHNLGANHDRDNASGTQAFPYAFGYRFTANSVVYHDIMAYDPGTTIPYFANPAVSFQGVPTGVAIGQVNPSDLATTFAQTAPVVASYRVSAVPEAGPPVATIGSISLSGDSHTLTFTVKYADDIAVNVSTLDSSDLVVTATGFSSPASFVSVDFNTNGGVRTATYQVVSAGIIPAGPYTLTVQANQVSDTSNNFIAGGTTLRAPSATLTATPITSEIGDHYTFQVVYVDDGSVKSSTIDGNDVRVTGPSGFDKAASLISVTPSGDGTPRTATYQVDSSFVGGWNGAENGTYSVVMQSTQVSDNSGNFVQPGLVGTFLVSIAGSSLSSARDIGSLGFTTLNFSDGLIGTDNLDYYKFTLPVKCNVTLNLTGLTANTDLVLIDDVNSNGAIDGGDVLDFKSSSSSTSSLMNLNPKTYFVLIQRHTGVLTDTNYSLAFTASPDATVPTASFTPVLQAVATGNLDFTVIYDDDSAINVSTIGTGDVQVTGPNGFSQQPSLLSVNPAGNGRPRTATYRLTTSGGWGAKNNGLYTATLLASQVADTNSNFVAAGTLGTITVNIPDTTAPTASLPSIANITTAGGTSISLVVTYSDDVALSASSIGTGDLLASGGKPGSLIVLTSVNTPGNGSPRIATYTLTPPGGSWDFADNGIYSIAIAPGQVTDTSANPVAAATLRTFTVNIPDTQPPSISMAAVSDIVDAGGTSLHLSVTYTDPSQVNFSTIGSADLSLTGPIGPVAVSFVSAAPAANSTSIVATYSVSIPGGVWDYADNGAYQVFLNAAQIADLPGNTNTFVQIGEILVDIADITPPTFALTAPALTTAGTAPYQFTVTYTDESAVLSNSLDASDVTVFAPGGAALPVTFVGANPSGDNASVIVTYSVLAPTGTWAFASSGTYSVDLVGGQVSDINNNFIAGASPMGTFQVTIADTAPPTAQLSAPALTTAGAAPYQFTITYSDESAVLASSLDASDLTVTAPGGASLPVTFVGATPAGDNASVIATYSVLAPAGSWAAVNSGTYLINLVAGQVSDVNSNPIAGAAPLGSFQVTIADTTAPVATVSGLLPPVTVAGATAYDFAISYTDDVALNLATIGDGDLTVSLGAFSASATLLSIDAGPDSARVAHYRVVPPGGTWDFADNGTYALNLAAAQVADAAGNPAATTALGTFAVAIPDTTPPKATLLTPAKITRAGATSYTFKVKYTDAVGLSSATLGNGDVRVTGPRGFSQAVKFVSQTPTSSNPTSVTVTYKFTPPGNSWDRLDNGTYTLKLVANQVKDTSQNPAAAATLGTFTVSVPRSRGTAAAPLALPSAFRSIFGSQPISGRLFDLA